MVLNGNIKIMEYKLKDNRGYFKYIKDLTGEEPMLNPVSWKLSNEWEDGYYLKDNVIFKDDEKITLYKVENNKIIEAFRLIPLELGKDIL
jgi:hypothetical protein